MGCLLKCGFWALDPSGSDLLCLEGGRRSPHFGKESKWLWCRESRDHPLSNAVVGILKEENPQSENCWGILQFESCVALSYRALTQCEVNNVEHSINTVVHCNKMSTFQVFFFFKRLLKTHSLCTWSCSKGIIAVPTFVTNTSRSVYKIFKKNKVQL